MDSPVHTVLPANMAASDGVGMELNWTGLLNVASYFMVTSWVVHLCNCSCLFAVLVVCSPYVERKHCLECRPVFYVGHPKFKSWYMARGISSEFIMQPLLKSRYCTRTSYHKLHIWETDLLQSTCHPESRDFSVYFVYIVLNFVTKI